MRRNEKLDSLNRRDFLKSSGLVAIAVSFPSLLSCNGDASEENVGGCRTTDDILGPFYKANAPFRDNIIPAGAGGQTLIISGKVLTGCSTPLPDAIVEVWNADVEGVYDSGEEYRFRGRYKTLSDGIYNFKTIVPGKYLNGASYRPSHVHFRITAPDHQELVSQIYFKDDPYISSDPWASSSKAKERILAIVQDQSGIDVVNFDINLQKA